MDWLTEVYMVAYVVACALVAALAVASLIAFVVGVLGAFGAPCLIRCPECDHTTLGIRQSAACLKCRHPHLTHPIAARHFGHTTGVR
jgi:hypothetical protein